MTVVANTILFNVKFAVMGTPLLRDITPVDFDWDIPLKEKRANNKIVIFFIVNLF